MTRSSRVTQKLDRCQWMCFNRLILGNCFFFLRKLAGSTTGLNRSDRWNRLVSPESIPFRVSIFFASRLLFLSVWIEKENPMSWTNVYKYLYITVYKTEINLTTSQLRLTRGVNKIIIIVPEVIDKYYVHNEISRWEKLKNTFGVLVETSFLREEVRFNLERIFLTYRCSSLSLSLFFGELLVIAQWEFCIKLKFWNYNLFEWMETLSTPPKRVPCVFSVRYVLPGIFWED